MDEECDKSPVKEEKNSSEESNKDCINKKQELTPFFEKNDHSINIVHQSEVPQICRDEPCQLGVDEAGRGPVLGPMVYGIAYAPLSKKQLLVDLGCADSKTLTEVQRDSIFDSICENRDQMGWAVEAISPNYISNCMYRRTKTSLNEVSMSSAIKLIKLTIQAGVNLAEVYVDTVGKPEKYQARLQQIFPDLKIVVEKKADSTFPIVSAASICAKVSRDHALRAWQFREGENENVYGSGYPNDPATKKWLTENIDPTFGFPMIVRFSWSTAETILESKALTVEWEEEEEDASPTNKKISNYFMRSPKKVKREKHTFFKERSLSNATGTSGLHMTALQIPQHVALNETVRMVCNFNLDQETLYSVKWYKDGHEFYRYEPNEMPDVQVYLLEGVSVDTQDSTERSVVLKNVNQSSTGRYRCEVSAEAPAFRTVSDHADMTVVVLPSEGPRITGGRSKYLVGDIVRMNCTSAPSKPAALLTWSINNEPADLHYLKGPNIIAVDKNDLETARLGLEFRVQRKHFRRGDLKLKCLATIATMYTKSKEERIQGDERAPVMESRETRAQSHTRSEDNGSESWRTARKPTILLFLSVFTLLFSIR